MKRKHIRLTIDEKVLVEYEKYYFDKHPRAKKRPIPHPYHESINQWMIMRRPMMNALKGKWKEFIVWYVKQKGYYNLRIDKCEIVFKTFFPTIRRHDPDNTCPKFILDGLTESGFIIDDDCDHITKLVLICEKGAKRPRTEIDIYYT